MGYSGWSDDAATHLSSGHASKPKSAIFSPKAVGEMSPLGLTVRESRDSDAHPDSLAVIVALDETGSMGDIPEKIVKGKLSALMNTIINNGVLHPQIMFLAIGDQESDKSPLQVGQFESGTAELDSWLTKMYLEANGGGQRMESYQLAWLVGGRHTSIDCFEKRNQKGFLFTIGDEASWDTISGDRLKELMGYTECDAEVTDVQLLEEAQRLYNVYHIHINETGYRNHTGILGYWKKMLGERFVILEDHNAVCETIATIIAMQHGVDMKTVVKNFDAKTAGMVSNALALVGTADIVAINNDGIVKL